MKNELCSLVRGRVQRNDPVRLISFGSGLGHEILGCIKRLGQSPAVTGMCVDRDPEAITHGKKLATRMGLDGRVQYIAGNVLHMDDLPGGHDIAVFSGLLDYFDFEVATSVLTKTREKLAPGGIVLVANMRRHNLASSMRLLANWELVYREPGEVVTLLAKSGYEEAEVWLEPEAIFCIGRGRKST